MPEEFEPKPIFNFTEVCDGLCNHYKELQKGNFPIWEGEDITISDLLVGSPGVKDSLEEENLIYEKEEQDRDYLRQIIACAVRLGIEQGYRIVGEKVKRMEYDFERCQNNISHIKNPEYSSEIPTFLKRLKRDIKEIKRRLTFILS